MASFGIVPAAGRSTRMGSPKLLLPWGERTVIETVIDAWLASKVSRVVVVVRPDDLDLAAVVRRPNVELIIPPSPPPEMKASVLHALDWIREKFIPSKTDAWLLAPADLPSLSPVVIDRLLAEHEAGGKEILAPVCGDRRGHPVLFPWPFAAIAERLAAGETLNSLVTAGPTRLVPCLEPGMLDDLDTPDDYRRLHNR